MTHEDIQKAVEALIRSKPWFGRRGYAPVRESSGSLDEELEAALRGGEGCAILVSVGAFDPETSDSETAVGTLEVRCAVAENPPLNRARAGWASASQSAEYLASWLNLKQIGAETLYRPAVRPDHTPELLRHTVTLRLNHALEAAPEDQE
jgi:hypothetical protein